MNTPAYIAMPTPPTTFNANSVLLHGQALFARHVAIARGLARSKDAGRGFVAELISVESTRCGASFEALYTLCPAVFDELKVAYDESVTALREIRLEVLDAITAPDELPAEHGGGPVDLTA